MKLENGMTVYFVRQMREYDEDFKVEVESRTVIGGGEVYVVFDDYRELRYAAEREGRYFATPKEALRSFGNCIVQHEDSLKEQLRIASRIASDVTKLLEKEPA